MYDTEKKDILAEKDKGVSTARNVLARLFRQVLRDLNIDHNRWHRLMLRYLTDPRNKVPANGKDKSSARGNLNKELRRERMTWKVLVDKAIPFLNPIKVEFVIKFTWANGKVTVHELDIDRNILQNSGFSESSDEDDDDDNK